MEKLEFFSRTLNRPSGLNVVGELNVLELIKANNYCFFVAIEICNLNMNHG